MRARRPRTATPCSLLATTGLATTGTATPGTAERRGTSAEPATGRRARPAAYPGTRYRRSATPLPPPTGTRLSGFGFSAAVVLAAARQRPGHLAGDRRPGGPA